MPSEVRPGARPGVCLTFDDLYVDNWLAAAPIFAQYEARVTFCVARLHQASPAQLDGLRQLQDMGHEIGFHSRTHPKLRPYLARHGAEHWLTHEIDAGVAEHRAAGFPATSFASPYHASSRETRIGTGKRFEINRLDGPRGVGAGMLRERVYRRLGRHRSVHNVGSIDFAHPVQGGWDWLGQILDTVAEVQGIGVFTGHDIRDGAGRGFYSRPEEIARLCKEVLARGLAFHTLTGAARGFQRGGG